MQNSTTEDEDDVVLNECGTKQASQTFRDSLFIQSFAEKDQLVRKAFKILFVDPQCSVMFLNDDSYVQLILGGMEKVNALIIE